MCVVCCLFVALRVVLCHCVVRVPVEVGVCLITLSLFCCVCYLVVIWMCVLALNVLRVSLDLMYVCVVRCVCAGVVVVVCHYVVAVCMF